MPISGSPAPADLSVLEGRLSAARATALDELLAANLPTDIANLNAQNVAILAAIAAESVPYAYVGGVAAGVTYRPAGGTIVMGSALAVVGALTIVHNGNVVIDSADMAAAQLGYISAIYCNGTSAGFRNDNVGQQMLSLYGVSLA